MSAAEPVAAPATSPGAGGPAIGRAAVGSRDHGTLHAAMFAGLIVVVVVAPFLAYPVFVMRVMCFALFASAFNLLLGFGGLLSFGHAAFFGSASYVCATATQSWGLTPELAILCGTGAAGLLGLVFGAVAIRRQGIYFAMITLAMAQIVYFVALQAPFTGGEDGIQGVPRGRLFGLIDLTGDANLYAVVAVIFIAGLLIIYRIVHSPFGQVLRAIRENENRALSLGYRVDRYRLAVFVMSAALSGLAGSTKAILFQLASLTDVHWTMSGEVVLMTLIGGMGTMFGPTTGALVFVALEFYLSSIGSWVTVVEGAVFVVCVMAFREGIFGVLGRRLRRPL
jgi:branched-chain amino acid transport system permease protein